MNSSYSDLLNASRLMLSGLKNKGAALAKRGLDAAFVANLQAVAQKAQDLDSEQEALKSRLAEQTSAVNANKDELIALLAEAKKMVKFDLPREAWKEFGITDAK